MSLAATSPLRKLLSSAHPAEAEGARAKALPLGLPQIDEALPDGGFPCGAVVEISSPYGLARATSLALAACASAQAEAKLRGGDETAAGADDDPSDDDGSDSGAAPRGVMPPRSGESEE